MHEATAAALRWSGRAAGGSPTGARSSTSTSHRGPGARSVPRHAGPRRRDGAAGPGGRSPGLRWDPLIGEWVVIAAQRQGRTFLPPAEQCPLDPSRPGRPDRDTGAATTTWWCSRTASPRCTARPPAGRGCAGRRAGGGERGWPGGGGRARRPAVGWAAPSRARTTCSARRGRPSGGARWSASPPSMTRSFADLPPRRVRTVLEAWADRYRGAGRDARHRAGVLLREPRRGDRRHAAPPARPDLRLPVRAPRGPRQLLGPARRPTRRPGTATCSTTCWPARWRPGTRVVARNEQWTAFVPGRGPLAVRGPDLPAPPGAGPAVPGRAASGPRSAPLYPDVLGRLRRAVRRAAAVHRGLVSGAGPAAPDRDRFALHLRVMSVRRAPGKLKYLAGTRVRDGGLDQRRGPGDRRPAPPRRPMTGRLPVTRAARVVPGLLRLRAGRRLAGAGTGQPDRRAHRLQRRLRAAVRAQPRQRWWWPRRGRRRPARAAVPAGTGGNAVAVRGRLGLRPGSVPAGRPTRPAWSGPCARPATRSAGPGLVIDSDVPRGAGLSSSAALECAVALALSRPVPAGRHPAGLAADRRSGRRTTSSACRAGSWTSPRRCSARRATRCCSTAAPAETARVPFDPPRPGWSCWSSTPRPGTSWPTATTRTGAANASRPRGRAGRARRCGTSRTWAHWPGSRIRSCGRRARHVVTENQRVRTGAAAAGGAAGEVGALLTASHASLRDDFEISWPEADAAVDAAIGAGALGARMIGGGFGGSVIALAPAAGCGRVQAAVRGSVRRGGVRPTAFPRRVPSAAAHRVA